MNNDLISRSALLEKKTRMTEYDKTGCGVNVYVVRMEDVEEAPAVDAVSPGVYEQIKWERDVAIKQLEELGIGFGQKKPDMEPVRHGKYGFVGMDMMAGSRAFYFGTCSECHERINFEAKHKNYCPNCGAKMDAEVEG